MTSAAKMYQWILFDADETLFHWDAFSGLKMMFSDFGVKFDELDYQQYQMLNKSLWVNYQNSIITAEQLQQQRFISWANKLQVSTQRLNQNFLAAMVDICMPKDGAIRLLNKLKGNVKLGIITNGFTELQYARLDRLGIRDHFNLLVVSEEVGVAKPHPGIFDHAFANMGELVHRENVLMVGDNIESDILGGINAGLDTCWLNVDNNPPPEHITPNYQITTLNELEELLQSVRCIN